MDLGALTDPIVFYTVATIVVIVAAAALFSFIHLSAGLLAIRTWLVIIPIALGTIGAGRVIGTQLPWAILVAMVSVLGFREFARVTGSSRSPCSWRW